MARVLVVEDEPMSRQLVYDVLEMAGHHVSCAGSVRAARALLSTDRFDLVLLDVRLPDGSGLDLVAEMQGWSDPPPMVAVTALAMEGDRERLLGAGFDGYISKPIDVTRFVGEIGTYLDGGERAQ